MKYSFTREQAEAYLAQGKTVRAAGAMLSLIERERTPENLSLLAKIYEAQGLYTDAAVLHAEVLRMSIKGSNVQLTDFTARA